MHTVHTLTSASQGLSICQSSNIRLGETFSDPPRCEKQLFGTARFFHWPQLGSPSQASVEISVWNTKQPLFFRPGDLVNNSLDHSAPQRLCQKTRKTDGLITTIFSPFSLPKWGYSSAMGTCGPFGVGRVRLKRPGPAKSMQIKKHLGAEFTLSGFWCLFWGTCKFEAMINNCKATR